MWAVEVENVAVIKNNGKFRVSNYFKIARMDIDK